MTIRITQTVPFALRLSTARADLQRIATDKLDTAGFQIPWPAKPSCKACFGRGYTVTVVPSAAMDSQANEDAAMAPVGAEAVALEEAQRAEEEVQQEQDARHYNACECVSRRATREVLAEQVRRAPRVVATLPNAVTPADAAKQEKVRAACVVADAALEEAHRVYEEALRAYEEAQDAAHEPFDVEYRAAVMEHNMALSNVCDAARAARDVALTQAREVFQQHQVAVTHAFTRLDMIAPEYAEAHLEPITPESARTVLFDVQEALHTAARDCAHAQEAYKHDVTVLAEALTAQITGLTLTLDRQRADVEALRDTALALIRAESQREVRKLERACTTAAQKAVAAKKRWQRLAPLPLGAVVEHEAQQEASP